MIGILVHGDNHFIVSGPEPDLKIARELAEHWSIIQIGGTTPPALEPWRIITRAFRENLTWAVVVAGAGEVSAAVTRLMDELSARGIVIRYCRSGI